MSSSTSHYFPGNISVSVAFMDLVQALDRLQHQYLLYDLHVNPFIHLFASSLNPAFSYLSSETTFLHIRTLGNDKFLYSQPLFWNINTAGAKFPSQRELSYFPKVGDVGILSVLNKLECLILSLVKRCKSNIRSKIPRITIKRLLTLSFVLLENAFKTMVYLKQL